MDEDESASPDESLESCTFCSIATGVDEEATIMMKVRRKPTLVGESFTVIIIIISPYLHH